jgi:hypothetical protein
VFIETATVKANSVTACEQVLIAALLVCERLTGTLLDGSPITPTSWKWTGAATTSKAASQTPLAGVGSPLTTMPQDF